MIANPLENPGLLALLGAVFGGIGVRVLDRYLKKSEREEEAVSEDVRQFRKDLLTYNKDLRGQLEARISAQIAAIEEHQRALNDLRIEHNKALDEHQRILDSLRQEHAKLELEHRELRTAYIKLEAEHQNLVAQYATLARRCAVLESLVPMEQLMAIHGEIRPPAR